MCSASSSLCSFTCLQRTFLNLIHRHNFISSCSLTTGLLVVPVVFWYCWFHAELEMSLYSINWIFSWPGWMLHFCWHTQGQGFLLARCCPFAVVFHVLTASSFQRAAWGEQQLRAWPASVQPRVPELGDLEVKVFGRCGVIGTLPCDFICRCWLRLQYTLAHLTSVTPSPLPWWSSADPPFLEGWWRLQDRVWRTNQLTHMLLFSSWNGIFRVEQQRC